MSKRIERLRLYLAVSAGLLLAILIGFIGTARYLKRHALARLGSKLGVDIRSETNGFTYSQSLQGRTIYTIHAAKEIEHASGVIGLHDVSMIIYGRTGDRADMVYGNEFEYDKNAGEVRAIGLVHIDIGAAGSGTPGSPAARNLLAQGHDDPSQGPRLLHATTSGLVYLDKLGVAATKEPIEFQAGQMTGHAVGADYNTDTGVLQLHSAVDVAGLNNGRPVTIRAAAAQFDSRGQRTVLSRARYASADQTIDANQVILHSRADNSLQRAEADGEVRVQQRGAQINSAHADITLNPQSKPENTVFTGDVRYTRDEPSRQARGEAQEVRVAFDPDGSPLHATFTGGAHMIERVRASEDPRQPWAVRDLTAEEVQTDLTPRTPGNSQLRKATARGSARLTLVDNGTTSASARGRGTTELAGDILTAHLLPPTDPKHPLGLDVLEAQGHTEVRQLNAQGIEQTSTGDTLTARFRTVPSSSPKPLPPTGAAPSAGSEELATAVQTGHVHITRKTLSNIPTGAGKAAPSEDLQEATAERATYDGDTDRLTLTGGVRLQQADSLVLTNQLAFDRATGDTRAEGAVRVSYIQPAEPSSQALREPVHVLAERADMKHASELATFFGRPVRLWQGGSQLQAPVVELSRRDRTLSAHADPQTPSADHPVQTILVNLANAARNGQSAAKSNESAPPASARKTAQIVRVLSRDLLYSDADRKAQFNGSVEIESGGETIHSRSATAWLDPAATAAAASSTAKPNSLAGAAQPSSALSLDGRLNRVLATGDVLVEQPGRRATGNRLLYLAQDASVLLTGDRDTPPKVLDTQRGTTVTAYAFRLHTGDESIEALSSLPDDPTRQTVHTETPARR